MRASTDTKNVQNGRCFSSAIDGQPETGSAHAEQPRNRIHLSYVSWKKNMGITKISRLFAANTDPVPAVTPSKEVTPRATPAQGAPQASSDAVVFSSNLQTANRVPLGDAEASRAARVQKLKADIRSGDYKVDPQKVAVSVLRDLA